MVGTWILNEAGRDVQKRYRIIEEREVYEYNVTLYEPTFGWSLAFAQHIDTFLKLKAEASGYTVLVQCLTVKIAK